MPLQKLFLRQTGFFLL